MTRRGAGRTFVGVALVLFLAATAQQALAGGKKVKKPEDTGGEAFELSIELAPVCLDGSFPVRIETGGGPLDGTLDVTTDVLGRLSGELTLGDDTFPVKGRVRSEAGALDVTLTARSGRKARLSLAGALVGDEISGTAKSKGGLADGATTFSIDATGAEPTVATISASVNPAKRSRLRGAGTVAACGDPVSIKASGKDGGTYRVTFKGKGFRFQGAGTHVPGQASLSWTASGYGARGASGDVDVDTLLAPRRLSYGASTIMYETEDPVPPGIPTVEGDPVTQWTITPALPPGLSFDTQTGVIGGEPQGESPVETHVVTAANAAGSTSALLDVGVRRNRVYSLARQEDLSDADIRHFLERTRWNAPPAEIAKVRNKGLAAYVDGMLTLELGNDAEKTATTEELQDDGDPEGIAPNNTDVARWWTSILMNTDAPFQETIAFFWCDHFAVGNQDIGRGAYMVDYVNLYRRDGTGNLRDLLVSMSRHPAMLRYLSGDQNRRGAPNENFAREFWELFTLGVDNGYTQNDIEQASRAFTGWRERSRQIDDYPVVGRSVTEFYMEFQPDRHDVLAKTFLGTTIPGQYEGDDFEAVVDTTLAVRRPELFIARKLLEYFALNDPPEELVEDLGAVLRGSGWELAPTLSALFRSEAFYSARARRAFVKTPLEYGVGFIRATGLRIRTRDLDGYMNTLGMRPTQPPVVDGWPSGAAWLSAQGMVDRTNLIEYTVDQTSRQTEWGIDVLDIVPPPGERTAETVVDALVERLDVDVDAAARDALLEYMTTARQSNGTVVPSPLTDENIDERVRGALYVLAQHPTYHVR